MYNTLGEVIHAYRKEHSVSMGDFAACSGMSKAYVGMLEKGINYKTGKPIVPSWQMWSKAAQAMNMTLTELFKLVPDAPVLLVDDEADSKALIEAMEKANNIRPMPQLVEKPRLGAIACGEPILAEENVEGYDMVPDWVHCDFTLLCKGDSMIGARIHDGDIVCIKQQPTVENGQIAAVLIDDEATLKRVRFITDGIALWPENPDYEPMIYTGEAANRVQILGLATHFISKVK